MPIAVKTHARSHHPNPSILTVCGRARRGDPATRKLAIVSLAEFNQLAHSRRCVRCEQMLNSAVIRGTKSVWRENWAKPEEP